MHRTYRVAVVLALAALLVPLSSLAATYTVPAPYPTIQSALNIAAQTDTVLVAPGTYSPVTNGEVFPIDMLGGCTLMSSAGPGATTIDAMGTTRVITCVNAVATIEGFTITGGHAFGLTPNDFGGAIYERWSELTVRNCVFDDNLADYEGGAILADECALFVYDCLFTYNYGNKGGGIAASFVDPFIVENTDFFYNTAIEHGGGIANFDSEPEITFCLFIGNMAIDPNWSDGGGVTTMGLYNGPTFQNCTFVDNSAVTDGSGLMMWNTATINQCIFAFNQGPKAVGGTPIAVFCTDIFGNPGGDWTPNLAPWAPPASSNFSSNPLFCGAVYPMDPYTLDAVSQCLPANSPCGLLVGARPIGCEDGSSTEETSWGVIKAMYR